MSFITGRPFVEKILSGLESSELTRLQTLINNPDATPDGSYRTYYVGNVSPDLLTTIIANNGYFKFINLSYESLNQGYHTGILCRVNNEFAFFDWIPKCKNMSEMEVFQNYVVPKNEQLTTEEFRRVLNDTIVNGSDGNPVQIKEVVSLPATGEEDTIYLTDSNAQTEGEPVVIPVPTTQDNGKALMVNSSGAYVLGENIIAINNDPDTLSTEEVEKVKGKIWYSISSTVIVYPLYDEDEAVAWFTNYWTGCSFYFYEKDTDNTWFFESSDEKNYGTKLYKHYIVDSGLGYYFFVISTSNTPLTGAANALKFFEKIKDNLIFMYAFDNDINNQPSYFAPLYIGCGSNYSNRYLYKSPTDYGDNHPIIWDDFDWAHYTDSVTEL